MTDRIAVLVDGQSTHFAAKALGFDIDFKRLAQAVTGQDQRLVRAIYYTVAVEAADEYRPLQKLLDFMAYNGWSVVTKDLREFHDGTRERGTIMVDLSVGAMEIASHVDELVLFTGDGEFWPLVESLQRRGKLVTIVSTIKSAPAICADDLRRQADAFLELDDMKQAISRQARVPKDTVTA